MAVVSNKEGDRLRHAVQLMQWNPYFFAIVGSGDAPRDKHLMVSRIERCIVTTMCTPVCSIAHMFQLCCFMSIVDKPPLNRSLPHSANDAGIIGIHALKHLHSG